MHQLRSGSCRLELKVSLDSLDNINLAPTKTLSAGLPMADLNFRNVQALCNRVDISALNPVLDLSNVTWFEPYALVYLGMFLRHYNKQGIFFQVTYPKNNKAREYLTRQNFWERFNFAPDPAIHRDRLRFDFSTSFDDIIDLQKGPYEAENVAYKFREVLQRNNVKVRTDEVSVAVAELVENFVEHAEEGLAAIMMQYYPKHRKVKIAVGDCGIGIKGSLLKKEQNSYIMAMTHKEAIAEAFKPEVTSKHEGGVGLYYVAEIVKEQHGELFLSSNNGSVYLCKGSMYMMDVPYDLAGVQAELCFPER